MKPERKLLWWNRGFFVLGLLLFCFSNLHAMLMGVGLMLFGSIAWVIDAFAATIFENIDNELVPKLTTIEARLSKMLPEDR